MSATPYGTNVPGRTLPKGLAIASLVLGILGLVTSFFLFGGVLGLIAVILGIVALSKIKKGEADGKGMAIGGLVTGAIAILIALVIAIAVGSFLGSEEFSNLTECVSAADNDQAEIQKCENEFRSRFNNP